MKISVAYCLPEQQEIIELNVDEVCTAGQAIEQSGLLSQLAEQELVAINIGIFGKKCALDARLQADDRIEIYRDLLLSPSQARKLRAKTQAAKSQP